MRNDILYTPAHMITYEIRAIVEIADKLRKLGITTHMENIGDPIARGERLPVWLKSIVADLAQDDKSYGYSPTRGMLETREFLARLTNEKGGVQISPDDILFFNGLGDAIQKIYGLLRPKVRVIISSPAYTTHSAAESSHAEQPPLTYALDPSYGWLPDMDRVRAMVENDSRISGLLVINPDNPTGMVWPEALLREAVEIAREHDLFLIADEVYQSIVYNGMETQPLCRVIGDVPGISMRGISKEVPWPGSRCGWLEIYNADKDPAFARYAHGLLQAKMQEVCSTTLPQLSIPRILSHPEYEAWLQERNARYEKRANVAYERLEEVRGLRVVRTNGAFYMSVVFEEGALNESQKLHVDSPEARRLVESALDQPNVSLDKRFVYYLLAATGVCLVPLSSFSTPHQGFRMTLLQQDDDVFEQTIESIAKATTEFLSS